MKIQLLLLLCSAVLMLTALTAPLNMNNNSPTLPSTPYDYTTLNLPAHFTTNASGSSLVTSINGTDNEPSTNLITNEGATLGRVLFYDKKLSANGTISCASCHQPDKGFSDPSVLSVGFAGGTTGRHSMTLINARWYQRGRFFWDERAATLEDQVLMPFQDHVEMGLTLQQLDSIVTQQTYYPDLFLDAFGDTVVTTERISMALSQFVRSIVSYSSKYDTGRAQVQSIGANFPNFTTEENLGKQLFFQTIPNGGGACFGCHTTEAFISANPGPQNNGLDLTTTDIGAGGTFTNNSIFEARFKTTTLRNIELTAPYMHDGRFATLEDVVEHYNSGIQAHPTLSPALTDVNGNPVQLNFTTTEKAALVAFLKTLTDNTIATEPKWSDPFDASLPVELAVFRGQTTTNGILLQWQTLSEINNESFTIEKSLDGKTWQNLTTIEGAGFTIEPIDYDYLDSEPNQGIQYYRLLQKDYDGTATYSKVISIIWKEVKNNLTIYPNPTNDYVTITFENLNNEATYFLTILDIQGKVVFQENQTATFGQNKKHLYEIASFRSGIYFIQLKVGSQILSSKFVITP
ncbi:MAG: cytochrome c peroxidase [Saprospiraceae bacterium]